MKIEVNGKGVELAETATLADLLDQLAIPRKFIAVERNGELIDEGDFVARLAEGDRLEIARFVGGG
ncbi:MAG: sulfur carrier protein ThiS [Deltaproteobacteria bacterium]|nr:sulfur carrier protein ThiS [Deltaproteobacteria bacterium]